MSQVSAIQTGTGRDQLEQTLVRTAYFSARRRDLCLAPVGPPAVSRWRVLPFLGREAGLLGAQ